ncbi:MAG: OmpA family protein [Bacteroidota bacterium]
MKRLYILGLIMMSLLAVQAQESANFLIDTVYFEFDRYDLPPNSVAELDSMISQFGTYPSYYIEIFGHTDSIGSDAYNLKLSELRARAVSLYLTEKGVDLNRITYEGLGTTKPVASNLSFSGRRKNRRADIAVVFTSEVYSPPVVEQAPQEELPPVEVDPASITDTIYADYNPVPIKVGRRNYIISPRGLVVIVPPGSFVTEDDEVMWQMKELYDRSDMLKYNMPTINKNGPLEAAGSFSINATAGGRAVRVQPNANFEVLLPTTRRDKEMALYAGSGGSRGGTRRRGRSRNAPEGGEPGFNAVKSWQEIENEEVLYKGTQKSYSFNVPSIGRYAIARPLYYSQNTERKDKGIDVFVKFKGKRFDRGTTAMITGEVVKTYIPLRKKDLRNYEATKVKFIDTETNMILVAVQYDKDGTPYLIKRDFKVGNLLKKKGKRSKRLPYIKLKAKFRKVDQERLTELLEELNV